MKTAKLLSALIFCTIIFMASPGMAQRYGHNDKKGVWRDAEYWHANHPAWVYRYHPEWVVEREEWWRVDHERHREWFANPYWVEYPVWTYGAYDQHHAWHYAGWWHRHDPAWLYTNHPHWAEPYPHWIGADHGRHPEWFRAPYWHDHPRDWNHPYVEYQRTISRNVSYQQSHNKSSANPTHNGNPYHPGVGNPPYGQTAAKQSYHPPRQPSPNKPANPSPPSSVTHSVSSSTSKTGSSGKSGSDSVKH